MKRLICILGMFLLISLTILPSNVIASPGIVTTNLSASLTPEDLVESLIGVGIEIQNVSYTGVNESAGTFTGGTGIIGFESGIILSCGHISTVTGPNSADDATTDLQLPGDADLDTLIPGYTTYDAVILEFDFKPEGDVLTFEYVFGSEEYNEWVDSVYNDVFGFFLGGQNIALLPDGVTTVAINNVNNGTNPAYYIDNDYGDFYPGPYPVDTELDGLTTVLSVNAEVTAGEWHHIKLAIGDAGDHVLDSDVFIKAGSFVSIPDLYLEPTEVTNYVGDTHMLTATYTMDDEPVPDVSVHFEVISGPHTGSQGDGLTDGAGVATWQYEGTSTGTDEIQASIIGTDVESNIVTKKWIENGTTTPPTQIEVGGYIDQINKTTLLIPLISVAVFVASGAAIMIWRRKTQS